MQGKRKWLGAIALGVFVLLSVVLTAPLQLRMVPITDLAIMRPDFSFMIVQLDLFRQNAQYGRDIVWTYGPLDPMYNTTWNPQECFFPVLFARAAVAVAFAVGWWCLLRRAALPWFGRALVFLGMLIMCFYFNAELPQAFWMSLPMLAVALRLHVGQDAPRGVIELLALASAVGGLVKFPFLVWGCVAFGLMAIADMLRRRCPIPSLVFAGGFLVGWMACGQQWSHLPEYFERHLAMTSGYAAAMAKGFIEPFRERDVFRMVIAALLPAAGYLLTFPKSDRRTWLLTGAGLACLALMCERYAFGGNQLSAAARSLAMMSLVCLAIVSRHELPVKRLAVVRTLYVAGLVAVVSLLARYDPFFQELRRAPLQKPMACLRDQGVAIYQVAMGSRAEIGRAATEQYERQIVELAELPADLEGTADFLGSNPGVIPPHKKLRYTPRPMIESINAHTRRLAEENAAFFRSERAPQHVLFEVFWAPTAPFDRLPAINDGPSWLELLSRYRLSHIGRELLVFSKRPVPRTLDPLPLPEQRIGWNEEVALPKVPGSLLWAQIEIGDTTIGKLAESFYKRPRVMITVRTSGGQTQTHFLVPQMAAAGFLLSPHVATTYDMALVASAVAHGRGVELLERVESIRLSVEGDRGGYFDDGVQLKLARVPLDSGYPADVSPEAAQLIALNGLQAGCESNLLPFVLQYASELGHQVLWAHAPTRTRIRVPAGCRRASVSFGLRNTAWNEPAGQTDGAEFRVTAVDETGKSHVVASKFADPAHLPADREELQFEFAIGGDTSSLVLETLAPSGSNAYDHTYWSNIQFE